MRTRGGIYPQSTGVRSYPGITASAAGLEIDAFLASYLPLNKVVSIGDIVSVTTGSSVTIQPGAGVTWVVDFYAHDSDTAGQIAVYNGTTAINIDQIGQSDQNYVKYRGIRLPISNTVYLRYSQSTGSTRVFVYTGFVVSGLTEFTVVAAMPTVANGGTTNLQPSSGKVYLLTAFGQSSIASVEHRFTDGVTTCNMQEGFNNSLNNTQTGRRHDLWLTNSLYLQYYNNSGAGTTAFYLGFEFAASVIDVVSEVFTVTASSATNKQPSGTEEWLVTQMFLNNYGLNVGLYDGTDFIALNTRGFHVRVTNSRYLRFDNTDVSNKTAMYCGIKMRS